MKRVFYTYEFLQDVDEARNIASILRYQFSAKSGLSDYTMLGHILSSDLRHNSGEHTLYLTHAISINIQTTAKNLWKK